MEATSLPIYELRKRFTTSEMVISGWRSTEVAGNMEALRVNPPASSKGPVSEGGWDDRQLDELESKIGSFADKMVDENGEIDLRRLTGAEALRYMSAIGAAARRR